MPQLATPPHSTLELAKHDDSTTAPERDNAIVAPENDRRLEVPQVAPGIGPQTFYNNLPPEAVATAEQEHTNTGTVPFIKSATRISRRMMVILAILICTIIMGLALGLGIGIDQKKEHNTDSQSVETVTAMPTSIRTLTVGPGPTSSIAHPLSDMNILADTSIGAFAFSNGDRRLIFQDVSGVLRQGFWSPDTKAWMVESDTVVATNAKNYTPISVVDVPTINANGTAYSVSISGGPLTVYVTENQTLGCRVFGGGEWMDGDVNGPFPGISNFTVNPESRHVSVAIAKTPSTLKSIYVFYESLENGIGVLNGSQNTQTNLSNNGSQNSLISVWTWTDIGTELRESTNRTGLDVSAPFSSTLSPDEENIAVFATKNQNGSYNDTILAWDFSTQYVSNVERLPDEAGLKSSFFHQRSDLLAITDSDIGDVDYALFWVNGTNLASISTPSDQAFNGLSTVLESDFPFARLASISLNESIYIYHQINATTFAEESWDWTSGSWSPNPTLITVGIS